MSINYNIFWLYCNYQYSILSFFNIAIFCFGLCALDYVHVQLHCPLRYNIFYQIRYTAWIQIWTLTNLKFCKGRYYGQHQTTETVCYTYLMGWMDYWTTEWARFEPHFYITLQNRPVDILLFCNSINVYIVAVLDWIKN